MLNIPAWWGREPEQPHFAVVKTLSFLPKSFALAVESINPFSLQRPDPGPRPPPCRSTDAARRSAPNATWNPKKKKTFIFSFHAVFLSARASGAPMGTVRTPTHTSHTHVSSNHLQTAMQTCINVNETQRRTAGEGRRWIWMPVRMTADIVNEFIHIKLFK